MSVGWPVDGHVIHEVGDIRAVVQIEATGEVVLKLAFPSPEWTVTTKPVREHFREVAPPGKARDCRSSSSSVTAPWLAVVAVPNRFRREVVTTTSLRSLGELSAAADASPGLASGFALAAALIPSRAIAQSLR